MSRRSSRLWSSYMSMAASVTCAEGEACVAFPGVGEAPDVGEFGGFGVLGDQAEGAAGVGRGELGVVADEEELRAGGVGGAGEGGEFHGAGHGGFVDDDELVGAEVPPVVVCVQRRQLGHEALVAAFSTIAVGEVGGVLGLLDHVAALFGAEAGGFVDPFGDVLGGDADRVGQDGRRGRGRGQRDDRAFAVCEFPAGGEGGQEAGLAGPGGPDQGLELLPARRDPVKRTDLVGAQADAVRCRNRWSCRVSGEVE